MESEKIFSYEVWDESDGCPHCGSDFVEVCEEWDNENEIAVSWFECLDCDHKSEEVNV